jgi:hypothetical protein
MGTVKYKTKEVNLKRLKQYLEKQKNKKEKDGK